MYDLLFFYLLYFNNSTFSYKFIFSLGCTSECNFPGKYNVKELIQVISNVYVHIYKVISLGQFRDKFNP